MVGRGDLGTWPPSFKASVLNLKVLSSLKGLLIITKLGYPGSKSGEKCLILLQLAWILLGEDLSKVSHAFITSRLDCSNSCHLGLKTEATQTLICTKCSSWTNHRTYYQNALHLLLTISPLPVSVQYSFRGASLWGRCLPNIWRHRPCSKEHIDL